MKHIGLWPLLRAFDHKLNELFNKIRLLRNAIFMSILHCPFVWCGVTHIYLESDVPYQTTLCNSYRVSYHFHCLCIGYNGFLFQTGNAIFMSILHCPFVWCLSWVLWQQVAANRQTTETRLPVATLKSSLYMSQMTTSMFRALFQ
jgi:hypothetical protein